MAAGKTEATATFERFEITMRFQLLPPHFRLGYDTVDIARHFLTSAAYRIQNENRKWK